MSESDNSTIAAGIDRGECDSCGTPLERGDLRCAICGKAAPVLNVSVSNAETIKILRCTGCGAAVAYDPEKQAPSCSFCDSVFEVETIEDPMEQTEGYLPFTVAPDEARAQLQKWLSSLGWFRPSDLSSSARVQELKPSGGSHGFLMLMPGSAGRLIRIREVAGPHGHPMQVQPKLFLMTFLHLLPGV